MTQLDLELIKSYTGGLNMPTATQAAGNFIGVASTFPDGSINLNWATSGDVLTVSPETVEGIAALMEGGRHLRIDDFVNIDKLEVFADSGYMDFIDDFIFVRTESGFLHGDTTWIQDTNAGTATINIHTFSGTDADNMVGAVSVSTGSTANDDVFICKGSAANSSVLDVNQIEEISFTGAMQSKSNAVLRFGFGEDISSPTFGDHALFFHRLSGGAWHIVRRNNAVTTTELTSIVDPEEGEVFTIGIKNTPGIAAYSFYFNGVSVGTYGGLSPLEVPGNFGVYWQTETSAARELTVDRISLRTLRYFNRKAFP